MRRHSSWLSAALWIAVYGLAQVTAIGLVEAIGPLRLTGWLGHWWWVAPASLGGLLTGAGACIIWAVLDRIEIRGRTIRQAALERLTDAAASASRVSDLPRLCRLIVHLVNRSLGLSQSALLVADPARGGFRLVSARYPRLLPERLCLDSAEPVIELLKALGGPVSLEAPAPVKTTAASSIPAALFSRARAWMISLEFEALVPAFLNERLVAVLALSHACDGSRFSLEELDLLRGLGSQVAMGIENARLFEELQANHASLFDTDKLANLGRLAAGLAHDINNPLTIISGEAQLHLERHKGRDQEMDRLLHSIVEECQRAAAMGRQILLFAKSSVSEVGSIDLADVIHEGLGLAAFHVRMEQIDRRVAIPAQLPPVRGNRIQLQGVVLKLIFAVCRAIGQRGGALEIQAAAQSDELEIRIGHGSSDCQPDARGSKPLLSMTVLHETEDGGNGAVHANGFHGVGLFISQQIIKAHHGQLALHYAADGRVSFVIRLPTDCRPNASSCSAVAAPGNVLAGSGQW